MYDVVTGHVGTIWIFSCLTVFRSGGADQRRSSSFIPNSIGFQSVGLGVVCRLLVGLGNQYVVRNRNPENFSAVGLQHLVN